MGLKQIGLLVLLAVGLHAAPAAGEGNAAAPTTIRATGDLVLAHAIADLLPTSGGWDGLATARGAPAAPGQGDSLRADDDDDDDDDDAPPGAVRSTPTIACPSAVAIARRSRLVNDGLNHHLLVVRLL